MRSMFILVASICTAISVQAAEIKVLTGGAVQSFVIAMAPAFERNTGHILRIENATAGALLKRIGAGESFDLVVLPSSGIAQLAKDSKLSNQSPVPLAKVAIGVAVKRGAPMPNISTVANFENTLRSARAVAYIDPEYGGSSGIYLAQLFDRMGMSAEIKRKTVLVKGGQVADRVVSGEADIAIHQISAILTVPGAALVGPIPAELQNYTTYVGGVAATTLHAQVAQAFLSVLGSPAAQALLEAKGMEKP